MHTGKPSRSRCPAWSSRTAAASSADNIPRRWRWHQDPHAAVPSLLVTKTIPLRPVSGRNHPRPSSRRPPAPRRICGSSTPSITSSQILMHTVAAKLCLPHPRVPCLPAAPRDGDRQPACPRSKFIRYPSPLLTTHRRRFLGLKRYFQSQRSLPRTTEPVNNPYSRIVFTGGQHREQLIATAEG